VVNPITIRSRPQSPLKTLEVMIIVNLHKTRQDKTKAVTDRNVGSGLGQALNATVLKLLLLLLLYNIYIAHYITITLSTSHYKTIKII
jgi:hypothetical protein